MTLLLLQQMNLTYKKIMSNIELCIYRDSVTRYCSANWCDSGIIMTSDLNFCIRLITNWTYFYCSCVCRLSLYISIFYVYKKKNVLSKMTFKNNDYFSLIFRTKRIWKIISQTDVRITHSNVSIFLLLFVVIQWDNELWSDVIGRLKFTAINISGIRNKNPNGVILLNTSTEMIAELNRNYS